MLRTIRFDAVLIQAVIAGALSFAHLHDLAEAAGQDGWKAWAYPVSVDLLLVAAWRRMRTLRDAAGATRSAWTWFTVALGASLGANVSTAGLLDLDHIPAWLRILVAGWPALAFLGGTLLVHTPITDKPSTPAQADTKPEPLATEDAPAVSLDRLSGPASAIDPVPDPEPQPEQVPERTAPPPVGPAVPVALLDHARKLAENHRATTGADMDAATLRARLGLPAPTADAIVSQLHLT
ncbi:DUF2637 domain-containing protein [Streptomyces sp. NPDC021100]|uniref:DUF2637 domain-containing protein n=1 Tax=Streptomyces sp. NPDC021100 TaxID=3365114 RepID=UPI003790E412